MKLVVALHPRRAAALILAFAAASRACSRRAKASILNPGPHGLSRDPLRLHVGRRTTTAPRSPASPATPTGTTRRSGSRCWAGASCSSSRCSHRRLAGAQEAGARHRRARSRRGRRCSSACSSASCVIVVGLTYFPVARARPDRRAPRTSRSVRITDVDRSNRLGRSSTADDPSGAARACDSVPQARPAPDGTEPGHVRRRGRQRPRHGALLAIARSPTRLRRPRSRPGSGSPCSSPTSPRRWPRAAARPRPTTLRRTRVGDDRASPPSPTARSEDVRRAHASRRRRGASSPRARSSRPTARSSRASRASTSRRSPASRRR